MNRQTVSSARAARLFSRALFAHAFTFRAMSRFVCFVIISAALFTGNSQNIFGQSWRIKTPRDTVGVYASQINPVQSLMQLNSNVLVDMKILGTYGVWYGQNGSGFDARYTMNIPGWSAPFPLPNPPSYNGTNYQIY